MGIFDAIFTVIKGREKENSTPPAANPSSRSLQRKPSIPTGVVHINEWTEVFDGEKTRGELGSPKNVVADYRALRMRAYEADLKADIVRAITSKFFKWVIGDGLKLESNPERTILDFEKINIDSSLLKKQVESRFFLLSYSKQVHYGKMKNLHELGIDAYSDSFLGGDCLVILRVEDNGYPSVQVVDGQEVVSPDTFSDFYNKAESNGNYIRNGVEYNKRGEHIAYYVRNENPDGNITTERIDAFIEFGDFKFRAVRMIYGRKHRINDLRGISSLTPLIEKIDKLDRYSEASVAAAEERANIVYYMKHSKDSTGENPVATNLLKGVLPVTLNNDDSEDEVSGDSYVMAQNVKDEFVRTEAKTIYNMPIGAEMDVLESEAEFNYDKFVTSVFKFLCASLDLPPEVALQEYNSNYSASRAAINAWQHILKIYRNKFADEFYQPYYELFFYCQCLKGKIEGHNEYIKVVSDDDFLIRDAFTNARFTGVNMPHIDPLKEVKAIRALLGEKYDGIPLVSLDQATEQLNQGDFNDNYQKLKNEVEENDLKIEENNLEDTNN